MNSVKHTAEFSATNHLAPADPSKLPKVLRRRCLYDSSLKSIGSEGLRGTTENSQGGLEAAMWALVVMILLGALCLGVVINTPTVYRHFDSGRCVRVEQ